MQILLLGAGTVTSRLNLTMAEQGHSIVAQMATLSPPQMAALLWLVYLIETEAAFIEISNRSSVPGCCFRFCCFDLR